MVQSGRVLGTFIGRGREVSLLDGLLTQVVAGKGQAVSVVGEPGMGKSRLVYEATRAMAARAESSIILEGRCVSYGSLVPYLPLIDLLRAHCGVLETDSPAAIREAIDEAVRNNGLPADAGAWLLRLISIVDEPAALESLSPEAVKARTFDALRLLFLKASAKRPLVIVVEDLHWIDRTSEEFLATLVGQLLAARILLIATYRPGYRPPWMERSYVTQITIGPLSAGESAQLLGSVAGDQGFADRSLNRDPAARRGQSVLPRGARAHRRRAGRRRRGDSRHRAGRDHGPPRSPARRAQAAAANGVGGRTRSAAPPARAPVAGPRSGRAAGRALPPGVHVRARRRR